MQGLNDLSLSIQRCDLHKRAAASAAEASQGPHTEVGPYINFRPMSGVLMTRGELAVLACPRTVLPPFAGDCWQRNSTGLPVGV
jgi:hypothetical protein